MNLITFVSANRFLRVIVFGALVSIFAWSAFGGAIDGQSRIAKAAQATPTIALSPTTIREGGTTTLTVTTPTAATETITVKLYVRGDADLLENIAFSGYDFEAEAGSWEPLDPGSATRLSGIEDDDELSGEIDIGFAFDFYGVARNSVRASSNGWLGFDVPRNDSGYTNSQVRVLTNTGPGLFPLWDDNDNYSASVRVDTVGTEPNRVFVYEVIGALWSLDASDKVIDYQARLYEKTNVIEFVYNAEASYDDPEEAGATIGIAKSASDYEYITLSDATANPTANEDIFTTDIAARPANGQIYRFLPRHNIELTLGVGEASVGAELVARSDTLELDQSGSVEILAVSSASETVALSTETLNLKIQGPIGFTATLASETLDEGGSTTLTLAPNAALAENITIRVELSGDTGRLTAPTNRIQTLDFSAGARESQTLTLTAAQSERAKREGKINFAYSATTPGVVIATLPSPETSTVVIPAHTVAVSISQDSSYLGLVGEGQALTITLTRQTAINQAFEIVVVASTTVGARFEGLTLIQDFALNTQYYETTALILPNETQATVVLKQPDDERISEVALAVGTIGLRAVTDNVTVIAGSGVTLVSDNLVTRAVAVIDDDVALQADFNQLAIEEGEEFTLTVRSYDGGHGHNHGGFGDPRNPANDANVEVTFNFDAGVELFDLGADGLQTPKKVVAGTPLTVTIPTTANSAQRVFRTSENDLPNSDQTLSVLLEATTVGARFGADSREDDHDEHDEDDHDEDEHDHEDEHEDDHNGVFFTRDRVLTILNDDFLLTPSLDKNEIRAGDEVVLTVERDATSGAVAIDVALSVDAGALGDIISVDDATLSTLTLTIPDGQSSVSAVFSASEDIGDASKLTLTLTSATDSFIFRTTPETLDVTLATREVPVEARYPITRITSVSLPGALSVISGTRQRVVLDYELGAGSSKFQTTAIWSVNSGNNLIEIEKSLVEGSLDAPSFSAMLAFAGAGNAALQVRIEQRNSDGELAAALVSNELNLIVEAPTPTPVITPPPPPDNPSDETPDTILGAPVGTPAEGGQFEGPSNSEVVVPPGAAEVYFGVSVTELVNMPDAELPPSLGEFVPGALALDVTFRNQRGVEITRLDNAATVCLPVDATIMSAVDGDARRLRIVRYHAGVWTALVSEYDAFERRICARSQLFSAFALTATQPPGATLPVAADLVGFELTGALPQTGGVGTPLWLTLVLAWASAAPLIGGALLIRCFARRG